MKQFDNILSFKLFEIATPIKPETYIFEELNKESTFDIYRYTFKDDGVDYVVICYHMFKYNAVYISFSTSDKFNQAIELQIQNKFDDADMLFGERTNLDNPIAVFSNIIYLVGDILDKLSLNKIGFNVFKDEQKEKIFKRLLYINKFNEVDIVMFPELSELPIYIYER